MARDVRQRMIEETMQLLARKGVQATSFTDVLEASGASRGSVYHHFPGGKDELVVAAMDEASRQALEIVERARGRPADKVAEIFISFWRAVLTRSGLEAGCALLAVTLAPDNAEQRGHAGRIFKSWRRLLATMLTEGGVPRARSDGLAASLLSSCEGAVAVARAEHSLKPFELAAAEQMLAIKAAMKRT